MPGQYPAKIYGHYKTILRVILAKKGGKLVFLGTLSRFLSEIMRLLQGTCETWVRGRESGGSRWYVGGER